MKMEEFHGIPIKSAKIHKNCDFCATETLETAESTKPYELPLQIGGFRARNHLFREIQHFRENHTFPRKTDFARKTFLGAKPHFPAGGGCGNVNSGLCFKLSKGS